jgi:hypothetical protein
MSRPATAARQKPEPTIRRARFAEEDLVSSFGEAMLLEATRLLDAGAVNLTTAGPAIEATIAADGKHHRVALTPTQRGSRVAFLGTCELTPLTQTRRAQKPAVGEAACVHRAAAALTALERDPTWRRPVQHSLFDLAGSMATFTAAPKRRLGGRARTADHRYRNPRQRLLRGRLSGGAARCVGEPAHLRQFAHGALGRRLSVRRRRQPGDQPGQRE